MASIPEIPVSPAAPSDEHPGLEERRALIERVAASGQVSRSVRLRDFLLYVGRQSLPDDSISVLEDITGSPVFLPDYLNRGFLRQIQPSAMSGDRKQDLTQIFNHNLVTFGAVKAAQIVLGEIPSGYPRSSRTAAIRAYSVKLFVQNPTRISPQSRCVSISMFKSSLDEGYSKAIFFFRRHSFTILFCLSY